MEIDDDDELLLLAYVYNRKIKRQLISKKRRRRRRVWVHETVARRSELGEFHRLIQELMTNNPESKLQIIRKDHMSSNCFAKSGEIVA